MSTVFQVLSVIALAAVAVVLLLGLANMVKGGTSNRSQQLMRLRVLFQAIAIVVVMITVWIIGQN